MFQNMETVSLLGNSALQIDSIGLRSEGGGDFS